MTGSGSAVFGIFDAFDMAAMASMQLMERYQTFLARNMRKAKYKVRSIKEKNAVHTSHITWEVWTAFAVKNLAETLVTEQIDIRIEKAHRAFNQRGFFNFSKASPHNCVCGLRPIFCPIRAVIKGGNTYSIPALL